MKIWKKTAFLMAAVLLAAAFKPEAGPIVASASSGTREEIDRTEREKNNLQDELDKTQENLDNLEDKRAGLLEFADEYGGGQSGGTGCPDP